MYCLAMPCTSVSQRTLYNTFNSMGTTPRRELQRRRVTEASRLAEDAILRAAELAALSGFTPVRQLTRALRRASTA